MTTTILAIAGIATTGWLIVGLLTVALNDQS